MTDPARRFATYEDVLDAPENKVAEVLAGSLYVHPRPAMPHAAAATGLAEELGPPFKRGKGGPGGWFIVAEPELHLGGDILVPDLGGWRLTTVSHFSNEAYVETRPDWVCEVLSPSTEKVDRTLKLPIYAREGVGHAWLVNPLLHTLEVLRLEHGRWVTLATHHDDQRVRAEPFDAIELDLSVLWAGIQL
ncbi:MAG: Uma2 family endonuclease [Sandaracinaceae bacterium]|jgi:Uma2 family endonuclease|nr:Uma2 family endonuclease [Sandaracinaceae bacterium]MBK6813238.1 Uma2 family endonuclease [Sandaracinaceae bacterium]MBK7153180.1 Uma2 family endonuclease [Sandaracinaceae bacterium]MBK7773372.1 Uma2 family endonuclease [Sandaracinaceae bacterium]